MISYAISNTHHSNCFAVTDTIDFPYLFTEVSQIQFPSLARIQEIESIPLNLDLQQKPPMLTNQTPS
jgi:hypothetical protein